MNRRVLIIRTGTDLHKVKSILEKVEFIPELILISEKLEFKEQITAELVVLFPNAFTEVVELMSWGVKGEAIENSIPTQETKQLDDGE